MNDFDALIAELEPLGKAMKAPEDGDEKIAAAAVEGGNDVAAATDKTDEKTDETEEDETLGKSFQVTLPDGTVQDAFDATDLVKSFGVRLEAAETAATQHGTDLAAAQSDLAKALAVASSLVALVKTQAAQATAQGELIKSLQADVSRIGNQPAGRRAMISVTEKVTTPATVTGPNPNEIMAKAMAVQAEGGLRASDIARLEARLNAGMPAPADILARLPA